MKKFIAAAVMLLIAAAVNCTAFANMDIVYNTKYSENIDNELVWNDLSAVKTAEPDKCSFTVNIDYELNTEKDYVLYMKNGDEPEAEIAVIKLYPNQNHETYTYKFPHMNYGNYNLQIRAAVGGETLGEWTETLSVMKMYTPQFLDQYSTSGVCGHVGRNENWSIDGIEELFLSAGIKNNRAGHTWYNVEGKNVPGIFQKSDVEKNDSHKFMDAFSKKGGRNISLIQGMPECWFNGENSAWNSLPTTPKSIDGYSQYTARIASWYPELVDTIEYLNEPNKPAANYPAADYVNLAMRTTVRLAKVGYQGDIDVFSFYNFRQKPWSEESYENGIYPYMTSISEHAYGFGYGPQCADKGACEDIIIDQYDNIIKYGGWKDIDWTETGAPNTEGGTGLTEKATVIKNIKDKLMSDKYNVKGYYLYDLINDGTVKTDRESMFGLVRATEEGRQPKWQYLAYANQNIETNGALQIGRINMGELTGEVTAYVYLKDGEPLMIAWDRNIDDGIERQMEIPGETVELIDLYGNNVGTVSDVIQLHEEPYYIHGLSKKWLRQALHDEVVIRNQVWRDNYFENLADGIDAESVFSGTEEKLLSDITPDEVIAILDDYKDLGLKIIEAGKNGVYESVDVSKMLFQLYETTLYIDRYYAGIYEGEVPSKLETDMEAAKNRANKLYWDDFYIMQYSNEILRHADRLYTRADEVMKSDVQNPEKAGIVKAWDLLSGDLVEWFNAFTEYEHRYNFGLISHIFVEADSYIENAYDGENKEVDIIIINEGYKPFNGHVEVLDESGEKLFESEKVSVPVDAEIPLTLKFKVNQIENVDRRKYTFNFVDDTGYIQAVRKHMMEVKPMIEAKILDCDSIPEELDKVQLNIKNLFALDFNVNVKLSTSDNITLATDTVDVGLTANEDKIVDIPVTSVKNTKFHHYTVKYEIYDSNGTKIVEDNVPLSFLPVTKASVPIDPKNWDGDMSDWYDAYPIYRSYVDDPNDPEQYKGANLAIRIMKKWDNEHLYILADVYDADHSSLNTGSNLWDGDCIQISLDPENNGSITTGASERYLDDDFEMGFALTGAGEEFHQWRGPNKNPSGKVEWAKIIRNTDVGCTRYLVALSASSFNLKLGEGKTVTFNVAVNEADALGREFFHQITNGTADSKTPEWYYDYLLVPATSSAYESSSTENIFPLK
jgi:hypothetical protein